MAVFVGVEVPVAVALGVDVRVWVGVGVIGLTTVIVVTFVLGMPRKVMLSWYWYVPPQASAGISEGSCQYQEG